jgi:hypothetical protein
MGFLLAADSLIRETVAASETLSGQVDTLAFWRTFRSLARKDQ